MAMSPIILTTVGVTTSNVWVPDFFKDVFNVGLQAIITGSPTYNIEFTLSDTLADGFTQASAVWQPVSAGFTGATTNQWGALIIPCRGIRINQTAGASPNGVTLNIQQAGTR